MWSDYNRTVELPPANRAETWIRKLYQASAYSAESNSFYRTWFSPAVSEEEWKALHEKFPSDDGCGACNHPNCLVLPFRLELIRLAA